MLTGRKSGIAERSGKRGIVVLAAAGLIFVLLAFLGLAFDAGYLQWARRRAQTAADAAAIAGAWAAVQGDNVNTQGLNGAADNGFTDHNAAGGDASVTVKIGRASC